jgi:hypothetical protein
MKTPEVFSSTLSKLKTRYLHQRQAPQEILEPNEVNEEEDEDEEEVGQAKAAATGVPRVVRHNEDAGSDEDEEEKHQGVVRCEFNEVKLCSRNGAFLIEKAGKGTFIQYSTQNSRVKGEVAKQKLQV